MPCDASELKTLIARNVNASKPTSLSATQDGFELQQPNLLVSCEQQQDPFSVFCTIPQPKGNDMLASMCNLAQQTDVPSSYFQRLVRGQASELDQMATLWESARLPEADLKSDAWIDVPNTTLQTFLTSQNYLGFDLFAVNDMSVSDDAQQLVAVRNGQLYESCPDGFLHAVQAPVGSATPEEITFITGRDTPNQATTTSPRGFVRAALFADKFFFYGNGKWQPDLTPQLAQNDILYQSMKMWITSEDTLRLALFYSFATSNGNRAWYVDVFQFTDSFGNAPAAFLVPIASIASPTSSTNPFYTGFLTIEPDNSRLYWSTMLRIGSGDPFTMYVYSANTDNFTMDTVPWELQLPQGFVHFGGTDVVYTAALANGKIVKQTTQQVTIVFVTGKNMFQTKLEFDSVQALVVVTRAARALSLHESLDHSRLMFALNNTLRISCNLDTLTIAGQTFALDDNDFYYAYVFALSPTSGRDIWIIRNRKLFRLHNPKDEWGDVWISNFTMMFAREARIDDFGLPSLDKDTYVPAIASRWYLGTVTRAQEPNIGGAQQRVPFEVARSAHQTFRYVVTSVPRVTKDGLVAFPHAIGNLQRANEYILSRQAGTVSVDNDSNVSMTSGSLTVWESNTHDRVSVQDGTVRVQNLRSQPFIIVSNNGLYLLYKLPDRNRLRLIFNPFNAFRMTTWCAADADRFHQALQMQQNLCWQNLKIPKSMTFVDSRCACIGGTKLFDLVAPGLRVAPNTISGPLAEVLPCFAPTCLFGNNGAFDTATNVSQFVKSRCSNRLLNICQDLTVIRNSDLTNGGFDLLRDCGNFRGTCSDAEPCDSGNRCVNGRCIATCTSNKECQQMYGLTNSSCVKGLCSQLVQPASFVLNWWVVLAIVCVVILIVIILVFVAIAAKRK